MASRNFTREFKYSAVKLVKEQGFPIIEAARSLGVDPNSVRDWVAKYSDELHMSPRQQMAIAAETNRLRNEIAGLMVRQDILTKTLAFLRKTQP